MSQGEIFILSAPSGAGKSTLIARLFASEAAEGGALRFSVSHTTRPPRQGEREGLDYHFVERERFLEMVEADGFLEWAEVHGNLYGTARSEVEPYLVEGIDVVLDIDVQGAEQVLERHPEAQGIFVLPPSYEELEERLRLRGSDDAGTISRRLAASGRELEGVRLYRYAILNEDVGRAAEALAAIVLSRRHRMARMRERVQSVLQSFLNHGIQS